MMKFKTLQDKCYTYKSITDYILIPNSYIMIMLDGRKFSKKIKNKFNRPFSDIFINIMNETALYLCKNIPNCKLSFVQSDEISILVKNSTEDSFFNNRLSKILSICSSIVTGKFNQLMIDYELKNNPNINILNLPLYEFDCKAWNIPNLEDVFNWFLFRQNDCIINSKQQFAQYYCNHKELLNLKIDDQIQNVKINYKKDWNNCLNSEKFGRFIYSNKINLYNTKYNLFYERTKWFIKSALPLSNDKEQKWIIKIIK